ncbi:hypothetical protein [Streptomyces sp. ATCC 21386]|uniref:hypothetical protein n=1 Tax=Streptomyces sp. ATCC 21386 TaxID=2699428 RepID=UPI002044DB93|nr:hypothetical protein [Streptomyces sp. ATCC 21386]
MAERGSTKGGSAVGIGTLSRKGEESGENTGTTRLKERLEDHIEARLSLMLQGSMGHGLDEGARKLGDMSTGALTATASHAKDALADKAKGATGKAAKSNRHWRGEIQDTEKDADADRRPKSRSRRS